MTQHLLGRNIVLFMNEEKTIWIKGFLPKFWHKMTGTFKSTGGSAVHQPYGERQPFAEQVASSVHATDVVLASKGGEFASLLQTQQDRVAARVYTFQVASCNRITEKCRLNAENVTRKLEIVVNLICRHLELVCVPFLLPAGCLHLWGCRNSTRQLHWFIVNPLGRRFDFTCTGCTKNKKNFVTKFFSIYSSSSICSIFK